MALKVGDRVIVDGEPTEVEKLFTRREKNGELVEKCVLTGIMRYVRKLRDVHRDAQIGYYLPGRLLSGSMRLQWGHKVATSRIPLNETDRDLKLAAMARAVAKSMTPRVELALWKRLDFRSEMRKLDAIRAKAIEARRAEIVRFRDRPDSHPNVGKTISQETLARYNRQIAACDARLQKHTGEL